MNAQEQKEAILKKLQEQMNKPNPNQVNNVMISNSNYIKGDSTNNVVYNPAAKDIEINGQKTELPSDALKIKTASEQRAWDEYMTKLKIENPTQYKIELQRKLHLEKMQQMAKGYQDAQRERDKRRQ